MKVCFLLDFSLGHVSSCKVLFTTSVLCCNRSPQYLTKTSAHRIPTSISISCMFTNSSSNPSFDWGFNHRLINRRQINCYSIGITHRDSKPENLFWSIGYFCRNKSPVFYYKYWWYCNYSLFGLSNRIKNLDYKFNLRWFDNAKKIQGLHGSNCCMLDMNIDISFIILIFINI